MKRQKLLYAEVTARVLTDAGATKNNILDGLAWLEKEVTGKDVAMVFLAGHGQNDHKGSYYFLPVDTDPDNLKRTGVAYYEIKDSVTSLAGKSLLFLDTCFSGNVMGTSQRQQQGDINAVVNELSSSENGVIVCTASTGRQYSLEDERWGNGAFTLSLVEGLSGKAAFMNGNKITIHMLNVYISERVKQLTGGKQTPATIIPKEITDFSIAITEQP